jgi:catechol 2,3-dioxygenase-like lactoylglutathione lyase family enzyme
MAPHDDHDHDHGHGHEHGHHHHHAPTFRLQAARVYCGDLANAITFYRDLLGLRLVSQAEGFAVFDTGATQLTLERIAPGHPAYDEMVGRFTGLSFAVADLATLYARMARQGVTFLAPPQAQAAGGGAAHFRDPAGNILTMIGRI